MKKLIKGIVEFRRKRHSDYIASFGHLSNGQSPDSLFIACSDSRVVPNTFASTDPGDLFVLRNVGNLIPPCDENGVSVSDESEASAIEYSVVNLNIADIIICGHSNCGAMNALLNGRSKVQTPHLKNWLRHGEPALQKLKQGQTLDPRLSEADQLSQLSVLAQMENVKSYPEVRKRMKEGTLTVHGWWFELSGANVFAYEEELNRFILIDETEAASLLKRLSRT